MFQCKKVLMSAAAGAVLFTAGAVQAQSGESETLPYVLADGTRTADYDAAVQSWRDDPQFTVDYSKSYLGLEHAYAQGLTGKGVTVGINDSGVYWDHPLFAGQNNGLDTGSSDELGNNGSISSTQPWQTHGTHVAGTAVGRRVEGEQMFGNAFGADIYSATTHFLGQNYELLDAAFNNRPFADSMDNLIAMAEGGHARIINNSWGRDVAGLSHDATLEEFENYFADDVADVLSYNWQSVVDSDTLVVFSAGNQGELHATQWGMTPHWVPEVKSNFLTVANYAADDTQTGSNLCGHAATWCLAGPGTEVVSSVPTYSFDDARWRAAFPVSVAAQNSGFYIGIVYYASAEAAFYLAYSGFVNDYLAAKEAAAQNGQEFDVEVESKLLGERIAEFTKHGYSAFNTPGLAVGAEVGSLYNILYDSLSENLTVAEGGNITSMFKEGFLNTFQDYMGSVEAGYAAYTGTSMAAPNVSGFAALLMEKFPEYSSALIADILLSSGRDIEEAGVDIRAGWGVPQMGDALNGPQALRDIRDVRVAGGTRDVWSNDITDAIDKYSDLVRERNPDDIGGLTKLGGGELVLSGNVDYTGATRVHEGLLTVDGTISASQVAVAQNGMIGGIGTLASLVAEENGVVAPGNAENPFGTLSVTGDATFLPGSYLWVRSGVNGTPYSKLDVGGTTTLEGGNVIVKADQGVWNLRVQDMQILSSAGGVTGTFEGASSDLAFLSPVLSYKDNAVLLSLVRNDVTIASAGDNNNTRALGAALDVMTKANTSGNLELEDAILDGSFDAVRRSLGSLSGEVHASLGSVGAADAGMVRSAMLDRGRGSDGVYRDVDGRGLSFWAAGTYGQGHFEGTEELARFRTDSSGYVVGIDKATEWGHLGLALGQNKSELNQHRLSDVADVKTRHIGLYGAYNTGAFSLRAGGSWFDSDANTRRVASINALRDNLIGDYEGDGWQAYAEAAWGRQYGATHFEPYLNYAHINYEADVSERGGDAALSGVVTQKADLLTAGLRSRTLLAGGNGRPALSLVGHLAWTENLNDDGSVFQARFADGPVYDVVAQSLSGDALKTELSVNIQATPRTSFDVGYSGSHGSEFSDTRLFGRFNVRF